MTGSLAGVVAQGRRTQARALALAYIQWVSTAEKQVDTQSPDGGEVVGVPSIGETVAGLAAAFGQGRTVTREAAKLGGELVRVALGRSEVDPGKRLALQRPGLEGQPGVPPHRARLSRLRTVRRQRRRRARPELGTSARRAGALGRGILTSALAPTNTLPATRPRSSGRSTPAA